MEGFGGEGRCGQARCRDEQNTQTVCLASTPRMTAHAASRSNSMARIRDAFRKADSLRPSLLERSADCTPPHPRLAEPVADDEIPFIEIGGKGTPIEASPCVMAQPGPKLHVMPAEKQIPEAIEILVP